MGRMQRRASVVTGTEPETYEIAPGETAMTHPFWSKVDVREPDECWLWKFAADPSGYGRLRWDGRSALSHRVAYILRNGPIGGGRRGPVVMHSCDNPGCCNPRHLSVGTQAENIADSVAKGRTARCSAHYKTRLTPADVLKIRADTRTHRLIAADYRMAPDAITNIKNRKRWAALA